jgi:hypothetical protein
MVTIQSKFIGEFKTGDNIKHNLEILSFLYDQYAAADDHSKRLLCKPIIVLLVSIIDAVLYDLHTRIKDFTREGVENIVAASIDYIRNLTKLDDLGKCIASAKQHNLLDQPPAFYVELDDLRKLRNRIHIQNKHKHFEPNEYDAFNEERKKQAEIAVEKTLQKLAEKFARKHDYVGDFNLPWEAHVTEANGKKL